MSAAVGLLTKADGATARPIAQLPLPSGNGQYAVDQHDGTAVVWSPEVTWPLDGAKEDFGESLVGGFASVVVSGSHVYGLDRTAARIRDLSLRGGSEVRLGSFVTSVAAGADGSLWAAPANSGAIVQIAGSRVVARRQVGTPDSRLQLTSGADGRVVVLDTTQLRLTVLDPNRPARGFNLGSVDTGATLGIPSAVVPVILQPGHTLVCADIATGRITTIRLGVASVDALGRPVASDRLVYVPDESTGAVLVVDAAAGRVLRSVRLTDHPAKLEAFTQDGFIWVNDPSGPQSMVASQGTERVFAKYRADPHAPPASSGPAIRPSSSPTPTPTPSPDTSSPTADPRRARPSPTHSLSGSPQPSQQPGPSGSPAGAGPGSGPVLLTTIDPGACQFSAPVVAWDPGAPILLTACGAGTGELWDITDARHPSRRYPQPGPMNGEVGGATFAGQGSLLFVFGIYSGSQYLTTYSMSGLGPPHSLNTRWIGSADREMFGLGSLRPDGKAFVSVEGGMVVGGLLYWDATNPASPTQISGPQIWGAYLAVHWAIFSPDGTTIAVSAFKGTGPAGIGGNAYLYLIDATDFRAASISSTTDVGPDSSSTLAYSPDGRILLGPGTGTASALWDVRDRSTPRAFATVPTYSGVTAAAFDPAGGGVLATGEDDGTVTLWKVTLGRQPVRLRTLTKRPSRIEEISFDSRRDLLAVADGSSVQLWKLS